jgi:hypothetical protein
MVIPPIPEVLAISGIVKPEALPAWAGTDANSYGPVLELMSGRGGLRLNPVGDF